MVRLISAWWVLWCCVAAANKPRQTALPLGSATPAPARSVIVNGMTAQTNADFTFARSGVGLVNGQNIFTNVAENLYGVRVTNIVQVNLPQSITLQYDGNGNLTNDGTRSFAYDAENRLVTNWVANVWKSEFVYDGLGRRRIQRDYGRQGGQWVKTNETRLVYDGYLPVQERDANNAVRVTYTRGADLSGTMQWQPRIRLGA